jgi:GNAT superfamily N-acetyltransferase
MHPDFQVTTDPTLLNLDRIEALMRTSYWAPDRSREAIERCVQNSLCIGAYRRADRYQVAFARLVTDYASFAWVSDVIVDEGFRGLGIGTAMMDMLLSQPGFEDVQFVLTTRNAHSLYARFGLMALPNHEAWMVRYGRGSRPW